MKTIKSIASFIKTGKTPPSKETKYFNGEVNWYTPGDLNENKLLSTSKRTLTKLAIEEKKAITYPENTLLIGCIGDIGKLGISTKECSSNQQLTGLHPKSNTDVNYLYYWFRGNKKVIENYANNAVVPILNNRTLEKIKIPLPPLPQQKKIAAILDAADDYRQKTKALIEKYDQLAQSLFLDMFGDPVINPKGWQMKQFSKISRSMNSKRVPIKQGDREKMQGKYPYYGATGIVDYIDDFKFDGEFLLIAEDGKNLVNRKKPIAWTVNGQFWVNNHSHVVGFNGIANLTFLEFHLNNIDISQYVTGIDQFKMNKNNLDRIPIPIPPIILQNQFAERVEIIEQQKAIAEQSLVKAEELFEALLQKAFNGKLVTSDL